MSSIRLGDGVDVEGCQRLVASVAPFARDLPMNRILGVVAGGLVIAVVGVYTYIYFFGHSAPKADSLEKIAMEDSDATRRHQAASDLISLGTKQNLFLEAVPNIRRVFEKSTDPDVRATMILGITQIRDWDSVPNVIDALADDSLVVRERAFAAVRTMLALKAQGPESAYNPRAQPEHRKDGIAAMRKVWEDMKSTKVDMSQYTKAELQSYSKEELEGAAKRFHDQKLQPYHDKLKELNIPVSD
jgi:hypothetical protein